KLFSDWLKLHLTQAMPRQRSMPPLRRSKDSPRPTNMKQNGVLTLLRLGPLQNWGTKTERANWVCRLRTFSPRWSKHLGATVIRLISLGQIFKAYAPKWRPSLIPERLRERIYGSPTSKRLDWGTSISAFFLTTDP